MRILELSTFSNYSVGKIMQDIKTYVEKKSNANICQIFYARGQKSNLENVDRYGIPFEIKINAAIARIFDNDSFCLGFNTKILISKIKKFNPDIVHIHCLHGYYLNSKKLFSFFKSNPHIKVVWTMHDTWAFTGHCCYFDRASCNKWKTLCYSCPQKKEYPKSILFDFSKKNYYKKKMIFNQLQPNQLYFASPSDWLTNKFQMSFLSKYNIKTIHNGVDLNKFNSSGVKTRSDKKIILGVASVWDKRKGIEFFKKLDTILDDSWEIILIGKMVNEIKFSNRVSCLDRTKNFKVLTDLYQTCDILINPSLDDNYPTVNLEAQACGAKVATFNSGGSLETNAGNLFELRYETMDSDLIKQIENISNKKRNQVDYYFLSKDRMALEYLEYFMSILK